MAEQKMGNSDIDALVVVKVLLILTREIRILKERLI
jgi:hypothetical protein